jgi:hypothetical protein
LKLVAAGAAVALLVGLTADGLKWPRARSFWDGPSLESSLVLVPALFYTVLTLILFALTLDLEPAAPTKGDLAHLLVLKRGGSLPARAGHVRGFRSGRWPRKVEDCVVHNTLSPESPLDRLVNLKRCGE